MDVGKNRGASDATKVTDQDESVTPVDIAKRGLTATALRARNRSGQQIAKQNKRASIASEDALVLLMPRSRTLYCTRLRIILIRLMTFRTRKEALWHAL